MCIYMENYLIDYRQNAAESVADVTDEARDENQADVIETSNLDGHDSMIRPHFFSEMNIKILCVMYLFPSYFHCDKNFVN